MEDRKDLKEYLDEGVKLGNFKFVKSLDPDKRIVSMIEFENTIFVATENRVFKMIDGELAPLYFHNGKG